MSECYVCETDLTDRPTFSTEIPSDEIPQLERPPTSSNSTGPLSDDQGEYFLIKLCGDCRSDWED